MPIGSMASDRHQATFAKLIKKVTCSIVGNLKNFCHQEKTVVTVRKKPHDFANWLKPIIFVIR